MTAIPKWRLDRWNRVTMLVRLNDPTDTANGQVSMWYNNVDAINQQALAYRRSDVINVGGLYLSYVFHSSISYLSILILSTFSPSPSITITLVALTPSITPD